jgi:hypothetical protein
MQFCPTPHHFYLVRSTDSSQHSYRQTHSISKIGGHNDSKYEDCDLLGYDIVLSGTQEPMFRQDLLLPSSWYKTVFLNLNPWLLFSRQTHNCVHYSIFHCIRVSLHDRSITVSSIRLLGKLHTLQYFPSFIATHPHFRRIKRAPVYIYIYIYIYIYRQRAV